MNLQDARSAYEHVNAAYWRHFQGRPGASFYESSGYMWYETSIPSPLFNRVVALPRVIDQVEQWRLLEDIITSYQRRFLPFLCYIGPATCASELSRFLTNHGLIPIEHNPVMACSVPTIRDDELGEFPIQAATEETLRAWLSVLEPRCPPEMASHWYWWYARTGLAAPNGLQLFLGWHNGKAVATSAVFCLGEIASLHSVSVLPGFRRLGFGSRMTRAALAEAHRRGARLAVLTASPMGTPLYRSLGFQEMGVMTLYWWRPEDSR